jgi:AcrR family transcriptional regulator
MASTRTKPAPDGGPTGEPTLRADARRNHEAILAAAKERFGECGLECQMDDIAQTAGVGVGTVYRHFPTKDDLIAALIHERFVRLAERAEQSLADDDPWEAFCDFMRWSAELNVRDRALSEVLGAQSEVCQQEAIETGLAERTAKLIGKAQQTGAMRTDFVVEDVPTISCAMGAVTAGVAGSLPASNWERFLEIILDGIRSPARNELPPPRATLPK